MNIKTEVQGELGANCYMVSTEKAAILIDVAEFTKATKEFIDDNKDKELLLLATHRHIDHISGFKKAKEYSGARLAIHRADACGLCDPQASLASMFRMPQELTSADILLEDEQMLKVGDITVRVLNTPGHTDGSCCFVIGDDIFSGDTLFNMSVGRTDFPTGSTKKLMNSLSRLASLGGDYKVYPGHESATTLAYEQAYNPYYNLGIM